MHEGGAGWGWAGEEGVEEVVVVVGVLGGVRAGWGWAGGLEGLVFGRAGGMGVSFGFFWFVF